MEDDAPIVNALLTRTVRLSITTAPALRCGAGATRSNTSAAWPAPAGLASWYEIDVELVGKPEQETGYIIGIDVLDDAVRTAAIPILEDAFDQRSAESAPSLLLRMAAAIKSRLSATLTAVRWRLTPRHELGWEHPNRLREVEDESPMTTQDQTVLIRDRFEFAAAHRLHCEDQSDTWNREVFGKCNNPAGHGHNYNLEVLVACRVGPDGNPSMSIERLEKIVDEAVIQRFDHRHLNEDCPEFKGLNPSVENIAITCHGLLDHSIQKEEGELRSVTVWETEKTSCTYPAR